uniref:Uncharacterized protein n=2 Tax=Melopsittacus undulatus TaxID=13146 RepID=A0A8V5GUN7_MELUD
MRTGRGGAVRAVGRKRRRCLVASLRVPGVGASAAADGARWAPSEPAPAAAPTMYNGIGLATPRGSGTNGYVQRNLSALRHKKGGGPEPPPPGEEELRRLEAGLAKRPNPDILDHQRKRKVELKCLELTELMEEQGYAEGEIQEKVATFRMMLLEKDVALGEPEQKPTVTETHQLAEANERKNERLRAAFGISDSYVDGSAFDPSRRAKETPPEPPNPAP